MAPIRSFWIVLALWALAANSRAQPPSSGHRPTPDGAISSASLNVEHGGALRWTYRQSGWPSVVLIGVTGSIALVSEFIPPDRRDPWKATLGIDESVRNAIRSADKSDRRMARTTSDVLAGVVVGLPTVADAAVNAGLMRDSNKVALEMGIINLEVLGVTAALVGTAKWLFSRERPYARLCGAELGASSSDCASRDRYLSHFSGHAAFTFASASAHCMHHQHLRLWGDVPAWIPCATGYVLAATTGTLRIVADRHYVTDVGVGALVGTAVGLAVPWFHYNTDIRDTSIPLMVNASANGATLAFRF